MSISVPITKPQFLDAFKTCDKYLKSNYIEQEIFFHNMVYAMGMAKQYLPDKIASELEFFDDGAYRKEAVNVVKTLGPEYWRNYGNMSEQMRAEANSHFFGAGTDVLGIAFGAGVGKGVKMATKAGVKMISRGMARGTKMAVAASRGEVAAVAKNATTKTTQRGDVLLRIGKSGGERVEFTSAGEVRLHSKTRFRNAGRYVGSFDIEIRKEKFLNVTADINVDKFMNLQNSMDSTMTLFQNPAALGISRGFGYGANKLQEKLTEGGRFSFGDHSVFKNKVVDVGTDFVPIVGNAKSAISAVTNLAIGYEYSKTAKKIEELENQNMEADRKFFNAYLFVDIEKDLNAMDKNTLYRMWLFASSQYNQMFVRKLQ